PQRAGDGTGARNAGWRYRQGRSRQRPLGRESGARELRAQGSAGGPGRVGETRRSQDHRGAAERYGQDDAQEETVERENIMHREALVANSSAGLVRVVSLSSLAATVTKATGHCAFVQWVARLHTGGCSRTRSVFVSARERCRRPLPIRLGNRLARLFTPNP